MRLTGELREGSFIRRVTRFSALVDVAGGKEYVFLPNPGRLRELLLPAVRVLLAPVPSSRRKTRFDLVMVYAGQNLVSIDARLPKKLVAELLQNGMLPEFAGYRLFQKEAPYRGSRFDFLLLSGQDRCFVEAKSVTLVRQILAYFPDAITSRGAKHLHHLISAVEEGYKAGVLFIIQRHDADAFSPEEENDPQFAAELREAAARGVKIIAYTCQVKPGEIDLFSKVK